MKKTSLRQFVFSLSLIFMLGFASGCSPSEGSPDEAPVQTGVAGQPAPTRPATSLESPAGAIPTAATQLEGTPGSQQAAASDYSGEPLPTFRGEFFSASGACTVCHTGLVDAAGNEVSMDATWRATMMANAARDPYWQAAVRSEVIANPEVRLAIEDECTSCHNPMARTTVVARGAQGAFLDDGFLNPDHELHLLAMDGVSCTLCHQLPDEQLGEPDTFSGDFPIADPLPSGERPAFGPFPVDEAQASIMTGASGFAPVESEHVRQAELCASCHTLYTHTIDENGEMGEAFPEQMPYLEWEHSEYRDSQSCQDCHMPLVEGEVKIATMGAQAYPDVRSHNNGGGSVYMARMLQAFGPQLGVTASSDQFQKTIDANLRQLTEQSAQIQLENLSIQDGRLEADLVLQSQVGHKFPSGYPSRRAWIHLAVVDSAGQTVFESGLPNPDGSIEGNDNDLDALAYEPHYQVVEAPDQVQIYEPIMLNTLGEVTTTLMAGDRYAKDNRLLPAGFDKTTASQDIAVRGAAETDPDFLAGGDSVHYTIDLGDAPGPYTLQAELLFQSIGYRWIENFRGEQAPEIEQFLSFTDAVENLPIRVASAEAQVSAP